MDDKESPSDALVEPLTRREQAMLLHLAEDKSYREIAAQEVLALNSVKWYIRQLYGKLGVNNRRQALERARSLGLLPTAGPITPPEASTPGVPPSPLPTGTVTFLFTDIQGSTPLWERQPEEMAAALRIHNAALRQAIEAHGGAVFKTVGDAFQAAFPTAPQALRAAIAGQQALRAAPWNELGPLRVRMGLHTGEAQLDPGGDEYAVSHTKNRAARIMSAAHGGQVLLSQETKELVDRQLSEGVTLKDLGQHRLKGMEWLEHLFQVCVPGLQGDFPPLTTTIAHPNNLPVQLTSFIGREREIEVVCDLLSSHRLVTLTGSGGTGKTRLSLQVAGLLLGNYPQGAWLVELASLADPILVPQAVASALNLPELPGKPIRDSLVDYLRSKQLLLILDNCEHLLDACVGLADHLLRSCPRLSILASSREFLGVPGEVPYRVPPMALPDPRHLPPLEALAEYDAVRLFVERARVVSPGFAVSATNATAVAQVVNRLDGIPLAIELAASRLRLLGIDQVARRLDDAFRLLTGGSRAVLPRHQTLRALIDWSYNLLSEPERLLLRRLSVFAGGWRLQAAERVCADEFGPGQVLSPDDILDLLAELVDKSLVHTVNETEGRFRYRMLETVRQYAHEKLVDGKEAAAVRSRHLAYYLELVEELEPKIRSREQIEVLDRLELELDNLRLALEWALQTDVMAELRLAAALKWFWHIHYHWSEGIDWLARGLQTGNDNLPAEPEGSPQRIVRAQALEALGFQRLMQYQMESQKPDTLVLARQALEESVSIFKSCGPERHPELKPRLAWALLWLGACWNFKGNLAQHQELAQQALSLFREADDAHGIAESLLGLARREVDPIRRKNLYLEPLAVDEANGDVEGIATAYNHLGFANFFNGDYASAYAAFEASLVHYQRVNNHNMLASCWGWLGIAAGLSGNLQHARECLQRSLALFAEYRGEQSAPDYRLWVSFLEIGEGQLDRAAAVDADAERIAQKIGDQHDAQLARVARARLARLQEDPQLAQTLLIEIQNSPIQDAEISGLIHLETGYLALASGDLRRASDSIRESIRIFIETKNIFWMFALLEAAAVLWAREGRRENAVRLSGTRWSRGWFHLLSPSERAERLADQAALRLALGDARFEQLYEEGRRLSLEQALAYALEDHR